MINLFYKDYLGKLITIFFANNIALLITKPIIKFIKLTQFKQKSDHSTKNRAKKRTKKS